MTTPEQPSPDASEPERPAAQPESQTDSAKNESKNLGSSFDQKSGDPKDPYMAGYPEMRVSDLHFRPQRRKALPLLLFIATCASTFFVGTTSWNPGQALGDPSLMWEFIKTNWVQGLSYMGAVLAILLTHEMGHFLQTIRHRIPASYPLCIPLPINPFGTMGAVIGMDGMRANRKEIFDIGIAGPLAGLAVAIPIMWFGVDQLQPEAALQGKAGTGELYLYSPVIVQWMMQWAHPEWGMNTNWIRISEVNPMFMAGWVGMLITGLNMMPISQLDGGHTVYALFGKDADRIARTFTIFSVVYVILYLEQAIVWIPMLILVILIGIHHPPTADDDVELSTTQLAIGYASLAIPILCFPLLGFKT